MIKKGLSIKQKKMVGDIILNLAATGISLAILEIIIYPLIARRLSPHAYGQMQTVVSIVYLFGATFGQSLSTDRLIRQADYAHKKLEGDYNFLLCIGIPIISIVTFISCYCYFQDFDVTAMCMTIIFAILICIQNYLETGFRLELNYKKILICRLISCIGYGTGYLIFCLMPRWQLVFIVSFLFQLIYCMIYTDLFKESYKTTPLFKATAVSCLFLNLSNFLSKSLTYFDKLILYPLLGGYTVSVYFTANLMGKLVLKVLEPFNNVVLSYLAKKTEIEKQLWKVALVMGTSCCGIAYFICLLVCKPILRIFYPQWLEDAMPLIPITTLTLCVSSLTSILYPFSLKILKMTYQCWINGICLIVYVICALALTKGFGLWGSCVALLIGYFVKLTIMIGLCFRAVKN